MNRFLIILILFISNCDFAQTNWKEKVESTQNMDSIIVYAEAWHNQSIKKNNKGEIFKSSLALVRANAYLGYFNRSKNILDSIELDSRFSSTQNTIEIYIERASLFKNMSRIDSAIFYLQKAIDLAESNSTWNLLVRSYIDLGELFRGNERQTEAEKSLNLAQEIFDNHKLTDNLLQLRIFERKAAVFNETERPRLALLYSQKALLLCENKELNHKCTYQYNEMGASYGRLGITDSSLMYWNFAVDAAREHGMKAEEFLALVNIAQKYHSKPYTKVKTEKAKEIYYEIIERFRDSPMPVNMGNVYSRLGHIYEDEGNYKEALEFQRRAFYQKEIWRKAQIEVQFANASEEFNSDLLKKDLEIATSEVKNKEKELQNEERKFKVAIGNIAVMGILIIVISVLLTAIYREKKRLDEEIVKKQALIQEVHHRTKNNIQFITSLLNLQMESHLTETEKMPLKDISRRVQAMGLVHEMLYKDDYVSGVIIFFYLKNWFTIRET